MNLAHLQGMIGMLEMHFHIFQSSLGELEVEQSWRWWNLLTTGTDYSVHGKLVGQQSQVEGLFVEGG